MEIPKNIGNYRIERILGSGGMANVYLATHLLLNTLFAIKVMKPQLSANDPMMAKRFVREAQLAQKINHPNIVRVFDVGCDERTGLFYIVMEYVKGRNLSEYSRGKKIPSKQVLEIANEMTKALIVLQEMGIVHRDIKPSNIMLCNDGSIKLMDLGIAKGIRTRGEGEATLTGEQAVLGTPAYSSPEQCMNSKTVDIRSDIYCLGASLYAIASGRIPYGGTTAMEILIKVIEEKPQPLVEIRPDLDSNLIDLIEWMMEKSPDKRPQTPQELLKALVSGKTPRKRKKQARITIVVCVAIVLVSFLCFLTMRYAHIILPKTGLINVSDTNNEVKQTESAHERPPISQNAMTENSENEKPPTSEGAITETTAVGGQTTKQDDSTPQANVDVTRQKAVLEPPTTINVKPAVDLGGGEKRVTLEERLADVEKKLSKEPKSKKYTDSEISLRILELAKQTDYVSSHFSDFKALVHQAQQFCLKEQIKQYEFARNLDKSKFDSEATRKVQESIATYTKEQHDWSSAEEFSKKLLSLLKSENIDPNVQVVDSTDPQCSGTLLFTILSGHFQKDEELVSELLKLGADANEALKNNISGISDRKTYFMVLTNGGVNRLENYLLPLFDSRRTAYNVHSLILLNHDVSEKDAQGNTALHYAVKYGMFDVTALLIASGADINAKNKNGETPLFDAIRFYQPAIIKLLQGLGADAKVKNNEGKTAESFQDTGLFKKAALNHDIETLQKYLENGFSPNAILEQTGQTLLEFACIQQNDLKMIELLLKYNADTELHNFYSCTPLAMTMFYSLSGSQIMRSPKGDDLKVFSLLLKYGANPNTEVMGKRGNYLMDYLITRSYTSTKGGEKTTNEEMLEKCRFFLKELFNSGRAVIKNPGSYASLFDPEKKDILTIFLQNTPKFKDDIPVLVFALAKNAPDEMIKTLIEKKANVNCAFSGERIYFGNKYLEEFPIKGITASRTALYIAVERRRTAMVKLLLKHGANKDFVSESGTSIRQLKTSKEIKKLLK